jgi:hypothetical protein
MEAAMYSQADDGAERCQPAERPVRGVDESEAIDDVDAGSGGPDAGCILLLLNVHSAARGELTVCFCLYLSRVLVDGSIAGPVTSALYQI